MKIKRQESQKIEVSVSFCRAKKEFSVLCLTKIFPGNAYNQSHSESLRGVSGMILYLDLFFLLNLIMDLIVLLLCEQIGTRSGIPSGEWNLKKVFRITASAGFGACWACIAVCVRGIPPWLERGITLGIVSTGMTLIAFGYQGTGILICRLFSLLAGALLTGGTVSLLSFRGSSFEQMRSGVIVGAGAGLALFSFIVSKTVFHLIGDSRLFYEVTLKYRGREKTIRALFDTGNRLREPYGNQPVHVITARACRGFCEKVAGVIYIPFCSVGQSQGMLPGIRMDEMEVRRRGQLICRISHPWIALSREPLSSCGEYEMLLNGESERNSKIFRDERGRI